MFNIMSGKIITFYLNIMRTLGVLPFTWDYEKTTNENQTKIIKIQNVRLSYSFTFFSIIYHIALITIYVLQIDVNTKFFRDMSSDKTSFTMQTAVYGYSIGFVIYYCFLVLILIINSNGLLKILAKYNTLFTYQCKPLKLFIYFIIYMALYCVTYSMTLVNFVKMDAGILNSIGAIILPFSSSVISFLHILFFVLCYEAIGNEWKNVLTNKSTPIFDLENGKEKTTKNYAFESEVFSNGNFETAAQNSSCLNSLQSEINDNFYGSVSLILLISICQYTSIMFSLISENNNVFIICGSICSAIISMIIIFVCCNSSRTSQTQVN